MLDVKSLGLSNSPLNIPCILIHVMYHANNCLVCHIFDPQYHHMVPGQRQSFGKIHSWSASSIPIWCSWQHNKIHQTKLCKTIQWLYDGNVALIMVFVTKLYSVKLSCPDITWTWFVCNIFVYIPYMLVTRR